MEPYRLFIQQNGYDGATYTRGRCIDLVSDLGIFVEDFPIKSYGDAKPLSVRDWQNMNGKDVYFPQQIKLKEYDIQIDFIVKTGIGADAEIRASETIRTLLDFLTGSGDGSIGTCLAIYDAYSRTGRKDIAYKSVGKEVLFLPYGADECIYQMSVSFTVYDPVTNVSLSGEPGSYYLTW